MLTAPPVVYIVKTPSNHREISALRFQPKMTCLGFLHHFPDFSLFDPYGKDTR